MATPDPAPRTLDLISLGECLVEFNRREDGSLTQAFAGDAFNALFYAGRLGLSTGFISSVGDDLFTPMIVDGIEREGIDTSHLLRPEGLRNGLYFIQLDAGGEYTFHFWRAGSAATETLLRSDIGGLARYISGAGAFLLTGVGLAVLRGERELDKLLRDVHGRTPIVFDTNYRARLWESPSACARRFEAILPSIDILLPTESDLAAIYPGVPVDDLCARFTGMGVSAIAMKQGERGCSYYRDGALHAVPPEPLTPLDTTGAGDAFNGGFLAAMLRGRDIAECCRVGQRVARHVLGVRGAIDPAYHPEPIA
ncbi:MAG: ketodeoxygluconokinase [Chlorobi bacterium]|nr:ketodeoxygluconokinase [Chlorobiota bacterium]